MGLAGRKTKQRIGVDPRNLTWSNDSAKFGAKYLQSLGWTSGTGLGVSGEGRTNNLKIHQKLDLMGIGANRRGPDGDDAGWTGGREFEGLLARLNEAQNADTRDVPIEEEGVLDNADSAIDHSTKGAVESTDKKESLEGNNVIGKEAKPRSKGDTKLKRKRKRCTTEDEEVGAEEAKRRRKEEERGRKERRKAEKVAKKLNITRNSKGGLGDQAQVAVADDVRELVQDTEAVKVTPRYRAHRARNIASKRLAAISATGMNEILGISSSTSSRLKTDVSSIPFPVLCLPRDHPAKGDEGETSAPGLGLSPVNDYSEQAADDTDIATMGLGSHSAFSRSLGFRTTREKITDTSQENEGGDLLRNSGKSVAEYFAEKMRMKTLAKESATLNESGNPQRKKGKKKFESIL